MQAEEVCVYTSVKFDLCSVFASLRVSVRLYMVSRQRRDGMFALNIMRKTRYDEVTAYWWTGSTDEIRERMRS